MLTALANGDLLAEKTGATPPIVIALHGWMRTGADFAPIVSGLDAVSIHLPGMGVTPEPPEAWSTGRYAEAVADAIEGFGPVILLGHSFGGRVAVRLAASRPNLVRGVVLTGVPLVRLTAPSKPALGFRVIRSLAKAKLVPQSMLEAQRRKHGSADYLAARGVMRDILVGAVSDNYDDDLRRLSTPVRMVWGELDTAAPADAGQAAAAMVRGARFRTVPGAGHLMEGELQTAVREELTAMIEETTP